MDELGRMAGRDCPPARISLARDGTGSGVSVRRHRDITFLRDPGRRESLIRHFMTVNRLTREQADAYHTQADRCQRQLDQIDWIVNFGNFSLRVPSLGNIDITRRYARASGPRHRELTRPGTGVAR